MCCDLTRCGSALGGAVAGALSFTFPLRAHSASYGFETPVPFGGHFRWARSGMHRNFLDASDLASDAWGDRSQYEPATR